MTGAPNAYIPVPTRIGQMVEDIEDVFAWVLEPSEPFTFAPGQFNMLYAHGVGEVPISISGDPTDSSVLHHTVRVVGNVTRALGALDVGDEVGIRGPFGSAWPLAQAVGQDVLFVAGGLGLAPLRPAILSVLARRHEFGQVSIIYGARSPEDILFRRELEAWRGRFDVTVEAIVDHSGADWYGPVGVVTRLVTQADVDPLSSVAMVCGPEIMMRFTARELEQRGFEQSQIWVSLERSMKCAVGLCGHCQLGGTFVCKDGPVYRYDEVAAKLLVRGL
jgi:NAD(P)H-flavin reductase